MRCRLWSGSCATRFALIALTFAGMGCSRESLRIALDAQRRADQVQQAVVDRQQEALRVLLYRDLCQSLAADGNPPTERERAVLSRAWNDRDLIEFWYVQQERARALRLVGVDAKLHGDQSIVDVLLRQVGRKTRRAARGLTTEMGERALVDLLAGDGVPKAFEGEVTDE